MSSRDEPAVQICPVLSADRDEPPEAVPVGSAALHNQPTDAVGQRQRRVLAAPIGPPVGVQASLPDLRGIDPMKADYNAADLEAVAVDDAGHAAQDLGGLCREWCDQHREKEQAGGC